VAQKKIVSFGDSFVLGHELLDNHDGSKAWPGLIAQELGCQYQTCAKVGCGNDVIAHQIYNYFSNNTVDNTLAVINWTWSMRWDFHLIESDAWVNLGPTCVPQYIDKYVSTDEATRLLAFYRDYVGESIVWNHYRNLQTIYAVQNFLKEKNITAIQTFIERDLFYPNFTRSRLEHYQAFKDSTWPNISSDAEIETLPAEIKQEVDQDYYTDHSPDYVKTLRKLTVGPMQDFEGDTFLDWAAKNNFTITAPPGNHPLEEAHQAAKLLWIKKYAQALDIDYEK